MSSYYAINKTTGKLEKCTATEENRGKGRCNHEFHSHPFESQVEFLKRIESFKNEDGSENKAKSNPVINNWWNTKALYEIRDYLRKDNSCSCVQATGTGKSSIICALCDDRRNSKKDTLILTPRVEIRDDFINKYDIEKNKNHFIYFMLFNNLKREILPENIKKFKNVGMIIIDEMHRVGAKTWYNQYKELEYYIKSHNPNVKIVGFTATPIRDYGNGWYKDMANDLFGDRQASNLHLENAIVQGILPMPTYVTSIYNPNQEIKKFNKFLEKKTNLEKSQKENWVKLVEETIKKNDFDVKNAEIREKYLIPKIKEYEELGKGSKILVFCEDIISAEDDLMTMGESLKSMFPNKKVTLGRYHSQSKSKEDKNSYEKFKNKLNKDEINILFTVEKLNEGVHVDDLGIIIMNRKTESNIIFKQQLGRVLACGNKSDKNPLVIDFVRNFEQKGYKEMLTLLDSCYEEEKFVNNIGEYSKKYNQIEKMVTEQNISQKGMRF